MSRMVKCPGACGDLWPVEELCVHCGMCFYCCPHPEPERDHVKPGGRA